MKANTIKCFNLTLALYFWGHDATTYVEQVVPLSTAGLIKWFTV